MPTIQLDDLPLYYEEQPGGPETLLALHATTARGKLMSWTFPKSGGYRVLAPDQRGHGNTPNPAGDYHMPHLIADMRKFLDALKLDSFHAIGYSLGAAVLLGLAVEVPERFKSLVMIGANHCRPTPEQMAILAGPPETRTGIVKTVFDSEKGSSVGWDFQLAHFRHLNFPVHLIGGDRDPVVAVEDFLELYRALPQGRLFIVPDCDHYGYYRLSVVKNYLQEWYSG